MTIQNNNSIDCRSLQDCGSFSKERWSNEQLDARFAREEMEDGA